MSLFGVNLTRLNPDARTVMGEDGKRHFAHQHARGH
jgi:hypothetical protein